MSFEFRKSFEESVQNIEDFNVKEIVLKIGESTQLEAKTLDENSKIIPNTEIVWNLSDPRSGSITKEGIFTAGKNSGTFTQAISVVSVQNSPKGIHYTSKSISVTVIGETKIRPYLI